MNGVAGIKKSPVFKVSGWWSGSHAADDRVLPPFRVLVQKEIADQVRSWQFIILIAIITLTALGSLYTALSNLGESIKPDDPTSSYIFLKLFTLSDGTMPSFFVFLSFLGPVLGIALGFDAINSEQNRGTLSRLLAQPLHRDYIINAKFVASLTVISVMFFALGMLVTGLGVLATGVAPTPEEFARILLFLLVSIVYVAFWLNMSVFLSVKFRQPATSALTGMAVWIFFTVFYTLIINMIIKGMHTPAVEANPSAQILLMKLKLTLLRFAPNVLYSEAVSTLLIPSVRSLGPLTVEQLTGALPGPLPLGQSVMLIWPHITALVAGTVIWFVLAYIPFMRREIRSR
jgi:ABC-2 type transport system permease protein